MYVWKGLAIGIFVLTERCTPILSLSLSLSHTHTYTHTHAKEGPRHSHMHVVLRGRRRDVYTHTYIHIHTHTHTGRASRRAYACRPSGGEQSLQHKPSIPSSSSGQKRPHTSALFLTWHSRYVCVCMYACMFIYTQSKAPTYLGPVSDVALTVCVRV